MKFVKGISLYLLYPFMMLVIGFYSGVKVTHFFYPGITGETRAQTEREEGGQASGSERDGEEVSGNSAMNTVPVPEPEGDAPDQLVPESMSPVEVASAYDTLCVDTKYVLEETDLTDHSVVETVLRVPDQYIGMNREQFLRAMELYESSPPLTERERGFVNLEVLSFSRERVVVRMNYRYVQPTASFFLAAYDNKIIVYLEDGKTVYMKTDISLDSLPEEMQSEIIRMMWVEDQEKLYDILEGYTS